MKMQNEIITPVEAQTRQENPGAGLPARLPEVVELQHIPPSGKVAHRRGSRTRIKRALWALVAAVLVLTLALGLRPKPVAVETALVHRGTLIVSVNEDGRTRVRERYLISAPLAGTLTRLRLKPGDSVGRGAPVARVIPNAPPLLDPRSRAEAQARVAAAKAEVARAQTSLQQSRAAHEFSRRETERQRALLKEGATASQIAEQAELNERLRREDVAGAEAAVRIAASDLRLAQAALARLGRGSPEQLVIRSPVRGKILRVMQESESSVLPGTPLLEIGDPEALEVVVDVLSTDAVEIRPGAPVQIQRWGSDSVLRGHVHRVEPSAFTRLSALGVEEQRVNVIIYLDGPAARLTALGDGYRVEASIVVWTGRDQLLVPEGAVFRQDDGWATYVLSNGRTRVRPVELGRKNSAQVEVRNGLDLGERVVLYPTDRVRDGTRATAK
jgi:HlyD family secretion protein